jgi:hypothetical protein
MMVFMSIRAACNLLAKEIREEVSYPSSIDSHKKDSRPESEPFGHPGTNQAIRNPNPVPVSTAPQRMARMSSTTTRRMEKHSYSREDNNLVEVEGEIV